MNNIIEEFDPIKLNKRAIQNIAEITIAYNSISELINIYALKQEKSIVKAQNEVALSQYLPTNSTLFLKDEKQKREKPKYVTPDNWKDAFKLIKLLWQTRLSA
jgi:hypothetical protein